ncbi:MAG: YqaA family protein [Candidatus Brocadiia bacterium]
MDPGEKTPVPDIPQRIPGVPRWHVHRRLYDWVIHWAETRYGTPALAALAFAESSFFPIPPDPLLMALALGKPRRAFTFSLVCSAASVVGGLLGYLIGFALWAPVGAPILRHLRQLTPDHQAVVVQSVGDSEVTVRTDEGEVETVHRLRLHCEPATARQTVGARDYEQAQTEPPLRPGQKAYLMTDNYHVARAWYEEYGVWIVFLAAFTPIPYKVFTILSGLASLNLLAFAAASVVGRSARFFLVGGLIYAFGRPIRRFIERYFNLLTLVFVALLVGGFFVIKLLH